jgi:signal transduction histidine kinase
MPIPVEIDISLDRVSPAVEATAYFIVAEALTNVAKHSHPHRATVSVRLQVESAADGGTLIAASIAVR